MVKKNVILLDLYFQNRRLSVSMKKYVMISSSEGDKITSFIALRGKFLDY